MRSMLVYNNSPALHVHAHDLHNVMFELAGLVSDMNDEHELFII